MSKNTLSTIHWEVWTNFNWGTTCKTTYETREKAREGKKSYKSYHINPATGLLFPHVTSIDIYKVRNLTGLSKMSGKGVFIFDKVR